MVARDEEEEYYLVESVAKTSDKAPAETVSLTVAYSESGWLTMRLDYRYMIVRMNRSLSHRV